MTSTERPDFTIVTLSFNQAGFLRRAIDSVLSQKSAGVEYIVVDPGSTDGSREIIAEYADRIDQVILDPDDGPAHGLQRAFGRANGRYYGCINSSDALLPGGLETIRAAFRRTPGVDIVAGGGYLVDPDGRPVKLALPTKFTPTRYVYGIAEFLQQSTFVTAESFHRVGGYDVTDRITWDGDLLLRLSMNGARWLRIPDLCAIFAIHDGAITSGGRTLEAYRRRHDLAFAKVMHRERAHRDKVLAPAARVFKLCTHPRVAMRKSAFLLSRSSRRGVVVRTVA